MAINVLENSLKNKLDAANPNLVPDGNRIVKFGSVLRAIPTFLRRKVPAADAGSLATLQALVLPDDAKAAAIIRAYARAGTAAAGELTVAAPGATPTTTQIAVAPNGDIVVLATDAWTDLDVIYQPDKYDLGEITLPVVTNVLTLPAQFSSNTRVISILDVTALAGTTTGRKIVLVPGAGAPAAGQARLNLAKSTVTFAAADAVTSATVKVALVCAVDVDALLTSTSQIG